MVEKGNGCRDEESGLVLKLKFNSICGICLILCLLILTGCNARNSSKKADETQENAKTTSQSTQEQSTEEMISESSIAAKDWKIKQYPVDGTDNLYELPMEQLGDDNSYISSVKCFGNQCLVMMETLEDQDGFTTRTCIYLIDPLTTSVTANVILPVGTYLSDGVTISDNK